MNHFKLTVIVLMLLVPSAGLAQVQVMTRNQYLGADLSPILSATSPEAFASAVATVLQQMAASNYPQRADRQAAEIVDKQPHLVALQEVFEITLNGSTGPLPFRDQLGDLLQALAARGASYYVAGVVSNLDVTIPTPGGAVIRARDRDVILARADVPAWPVFPATCRLSVDGCNFGVVAAFQSPLGPIRIERGYVVVDAIIEARQVRLVNTHLEIPELPRVIQSAQAAELIAAVSAMPRPAGTPLLLAGDFNSAPEDEVIPTGGVPIVPPYLQLASAGLIDLWQLRPGNSPGFTCCESTDLRNAESQHFKRVDLILTDTMPATVKANLVGVDAAERTESGLWPSDHAGVVARVAFEP